MDFTAAVSRRHDPPSRPRVGKRSGQAIAAKLLKVFQPGVIHWRLGYTYPELIGPRVRKVEDDTIATSCRAELQVLVAERTVRGELFWISGTMGGTRSYSRAHR